MGYIAIDIVDLKKSFLRQSYFLSLLSRQYCLSNSSRINFIGKMHGNLSLAREIFLPRRSDSDIKDKKQTEEYKEFRQIQKEFENYGQSKKRKVDSVNEPKQKESSTTIEKKSGSDTPNKNEKQKPSLKEKKKIEIPNKEKKKAKK